MDRDPVFIREGNVLLYPRIGRKWSSFNFIPNASQAIFFFGSQEDNFPIPFGYFGKRNMYKAATEVFGMPPSVIAKLFNAFMLEIWREEPFHTKLGFNNVGLSVPKVIRIHETLPLLRQAEAVGSMNITPFIHYFKAGPGELRSLFGRGLWRELSRNSFSRNKLLITNASSNLIAGFCDLNAPLSEAPAVAQRVSYLRSLPSTLLRAKPELSLPRSAEVFKLLVNDGLSYKEAVNTLSFSRQVRFLVEDTNRMLEQEGLPPFKGKSFKACERLHESLSKNRLRRTYSDEPLSPKLPTVVIDGVEFVHLASAFALQEEGEALHHCVGSYSGYVGTGKVLVFSVRKDGKRIGTLSYTPSPRMRFNKPVTFWETHQFLGPCNSPISDVEVLSAWNKFTLEINK